VVCVASALCQGLSAVCCVLSAAQVAQAQDEIKECSRKAPCRIAHKDKLTAMRQGFGVAGTRSQCYH
jgi:hypothetical protein